MFALSNMPLDPKALRSSLTNHAAGALVTFEGWVRDHHEGRAVTALEYEAYEQLAVKEGSRIISAAQKKFAIKQVICVHRTGALKLGDIAVWIGVSAAHRDAAFEACRFVIDEVKSRVPIWKKEFYADGDSGWVNCEGCAREDHHH